jgi:hypothetical protein
MNDNVRHPVRPSHLLVLLLFALSSCAANSTRIKLETVLDQELPPDWEWVFSQNGSKRIITISDLMSVYEKTGKGERPRAANVSLNCPDALSELRDLDQTLLNAGAKPPAELPQKKFFAVESAPFRFVDFAKNLSGIDGKVGADLDRTSFEMSYHNRSMTVNLAILYSEYKISARERFLDCVRSSLRDAGKKGTYLLPKDLLVGGMVILTFSAKERSAKSLTSAADLAHAEVSVDLNDVKVSFYQWGSTKAQLRGSDLLEPLRVESPDPLTSVGRLRANVDKHGLVAIRRVEAVL